MNRKKQQIVFSSLDRVLSEFKVDLNKVGEMFVMKTFADVDFDIEMVKSKKAPRLKALPKAYSKPSQKVKQRGKRKGYRNRVIRTITAIKWKRVEHFIKTINNFLENSPTEILDDVCQTSYEEFQQNVDDVLLEFLIRDNDDSQEGKMSEDRTNYANASINNVVFEKLENLTFNFEVR